MSEMESQDFFRDDELINDPYPYLAALRPAGSILMVLNGAANRDPKHFDEPDTLDPARPNARRHIAFGRGVHSCPGAPLARAEARVCIERLLERTTDIRIAENKHGPAEDRHYQYVPTYILRGLTELHLEFAL
jgi:cytochrome P450 family 150 subfamily A5